jgi:hypothetical protein
MVSQRKDGPRRGRLGASNHQEDDVNVRFPYRLAAAAAGLWLSSVGFAQQPIQTTNAQGGPETLGAPAPYGPAVGAPGAIDPVPLNGPAFSALNPPHMPPYAWPTYAPYNNYSRVAYPNEYPQQAFPYIGPMYPFPKVPLGYRAIKLEWEDGHWWYGRTATKRDYWTVRYW